MLAKFVSMGRCSSDIAANASQAVNSGRNIQISSFANEFSLVGRGMRVKISRLQCGDCNTTSLFAMPQVEWLKLQDRDESEIRNDN
jgi:hypothetical protein